MAMQVAVAALLVVIAKAAWDVWNAEGGARRAAAVHDADRALGAAGNRNGEPRQCCGICLSEYATGDELVRVVPACGHFFHARCGVDAWLPARPLCRGRLWPLPECSPMPPRAAVDVAVVQSVNLLPFNLHC